MFVLLNASSNNGQGLLKWEESRPELERRFLGRNYDLVTDLARLKSWFAGELHRGDKVVVAAGGDGTVNYLLNRVMELGDEVRRDVVLGAVGIGSSNDFHKPFSPARCLNRNVAFRLDASHASRHNVGEAEFINIEGRRERRFFIINASIGITAAANFSFNAGGRVINWLKPRWVLGAIYFTALKTIFTAQNVPVRLVIDGREELRTEVTNLGVIINPHFSGNLSYDFDSFERGDRFGVALGEGMGFTERLRTLAALANGRFSGLPKTRTWRACSVDIEPEVPTPLELDGEVVLARAIRIRLLQDAVKVCA